MPVGLVDPMDRIDHTAKVEEEVALGEVMLLTVEMVAFLLLLLLWSVFSGSTF